MKLLWIAFPFLAAACSEARATPPAPSFYAYEVGDSMYIAAMNAQGRMTGHAAGQAYITDPFGKNRVAIGEPGVRSEGIAINASGQVIGLSNGKPFITDANGAHMREIQLPVADYTDARPLGINDAGQVVGRYTYWRDSRWVTRGFYTGPNGTGAVEFRNALDPDQSGLHAINNAGQMAGMSWSYDLQAGQLFVTEPFGEAYIRVLDRVFTGSFVTLLDNGIAAGNFQSNRDGLLNLPTVLEVGQPAKVLKSITGRNAYVMGINSRGDSVGYAIQPFAGQAHRAWVALRHGRAVRLTPLVANFREGQSLREAVAITDDGRIAANGNHKAFILCPVESADECDAELRR